jgi:hypothetical protein
LTLWPAYLFVGLVVVMAIAVLLASAWFAGGRPDFWYGLGKLVWADLWPRLGKMVLGRMSPAEEAGWRHEQLTSANPPGMRSRHPRRDR